MERPMSNDMSALIFTATIGPIHIACLFGVLFLQFAPVFASRVPRVVLGSILSKLVGFSLISWLFLDHNCPCGVVPFMFWADWTGSCWLTLKRVILLFRYEIQAALNKSKEGSNVAALDESNFFVRYRQILRPRTHSWVMLALWVYIGVANMIVLALYSDLAIKPCTYDIFVDNNLLLGAIIVAWITAFPMMSVSVWASRGLRKFPLDNWKMGTENSVASGFTVVSAIVCATVLATVPRFDGILWVFFAGSIFVALLQVLLPLSLHRSTLAQLSHLEIKALTSLDKLLLNEEFRDAFAAFLRKEFSSENLYFWLEVNRLQVLYGVLLRLPELPSEGRSGNTRDSHEVKTLVREGESDRTALITQAANDCRALGKHILGESAPWQLNISGFTAEALGDDMREIDKQLKGGSADDLARVAADALERLGTLKLEVYELLRKDPYPRFLLTPVAADLNHNENFKRLLASQKLEDEVQKSLGSHKPEHGSTEGGSSGHGSKNRTGVEEKTTKRTSLLGYITGTRGDRSRSENKSPSRGDTKNPSHHSANEASEAKSPDDGSVRSSDVSLAMVGVGSPDSGSVRSSDVSLEIAGVGPPDNGSVRSSDVSLEIAVVGPPDNGSVRSSDVSLEVAAVGLPDNA